MGRPRSIRSQPTSGVGGRLLSFGEARTILGIARGYATEVDGKKLIERVWHELGSYQASVDALAKQVGLAGELRDLESIVLQAVTVRRLLAEVVDAKDDLGCVKPAADLAERVRRFPNMIAAEVSGTPCGPAFEAARIRLMDWLVRVRFWPERRAQLLADLDVLLEVCRTAPVPEGFTKRPLTARDRFADRLADIYSEMLHPERVELWQNGRRGASNDPPPPSSHLAFATAVMKALGVPFEAKS